MKHIQRSILFLSIILASFSIKSMHSPQSRTSSRSTPEIPTALTEPSATKRIKEEEIESIKYFLRTAIVRKAYELPEENENHYWYNQALNNACQNRYREHNKEITALALACCAQIHAPIPVRHYLSQAVHNKLHDVTEYLLENQVARKAYRSESPTPLCFAICNDDVSMIKKLHDAGITFAAKKTPDIHIAAEQNACKTIQFLYNAGYNLNIQDENLQTALHKAAINGNINSIYLLTKLGADQRIQDNQGKTYDNYLKEFHYVSPNLKDENHTTIMSSPGSTDSLSDLTSTTSFNSMSTKSVSYDDTHNKTSSENADDTCNLLSWFLKFYNKN